MNYKKWTNKVHIKKTQTTTSVTNLLKKMEKMANNKMKMSKIKMMIKKEKRRKVNKSKKMKRKEIIISNILMPIKRSKLMRL